MADILKHRYDLVVLKLGLDLPSTGRTGVRIRCDIEAKVAGQLTTLARCDLAPDEFGIPSRLDARESRYQGYSFRVPSELIEMLQNTLAQADLAGRPLWLHLVAPYGYLGVVPWERMLVSQLHIPILRFPDFIVPPPSETRSTLDVALCCSMPTAKESFDVTDQIPAMVDKIREAAPRDRMTVHVFANAEFYGQLQHAFSNRGLLNAGVRLYQPNDAYSIPEPSSQIADPGNWLISPWLLWMRDSLQGRSIDVVHFLCHGYLANNRGAIAFSQSPTRNEDSRIARFVGSSELDMFLTQVGAWSCAFSSPRRNFSEMGLRMLADTLAQHRPLAILHHETALDPDGQVLRDAYRFLYATTPVAPPISPSVFFYCQPYRVPSDVSFIEPQALSADDTFPLAEPINVEGLADETGALPNWFSAGERFFEQQRFDLERTLDLSPQRDSRASTQTVNSTLRQMQEILMRSVRSRKGGPS